MYSVRGADIPLIAIKLKSNYAVLGAFLALDLTLTMVKTLISP